jgi:hypothetical protein
MFHSRKRHSVVLHPSYQDVESEKKTLGFSRNAFPIAIEPQLRTLMNHPLAPLPLHPTDCLRPWQV